MKPTDARSFAEALGVLGETFNEPVSDVRIEAYFQALADLETPAVIGAMRQAVRSCRFFPKPVELRAMVEGDSETRADAAWGYVLQGIRRVGYMGFPAFDDPRIMPAIRDVWGSWEHLCSTLPAEGPELVGWIKQFKSAYRSVDARAEQDAFMGSMPKQIGESLKAIAASKVLR